MKNLININKLNKITDNETAYVLGYLCWAGFRSNAYDRFVIQVLNTEKHDLYNIKKLFKVGSKLKQAGSRSIRLTASARGLTDVLNKWYVAKDSEKGFPKVPKKFQTDFIRGFFERHGYVNTPKNTVKLTVPSIQFAKDLQNILKNLKIQTKYTAEIRNGTTTHRVWIVRQSVGVFYELLYSNVKRTHRRKTALKNLTNIQQTRISRQSRQASVLLEWVRELNEDGASLYRISKELGISKKRAQNYVDYIEM